MAFRALSLLLSTLLAAPAPSAFGATSEPSPTSWAARLTRLAASVKEVEGRLNYLIQVGPVCAPMSWTYECKQYPTPQQQFAVAKKNAEEAADKIKKLQGSAVVADKAPTTSTAKNTTICSGSYEDVVNDVKARTPAAKAIAAGLQESLAHLEKIWNSINVTPDKFAESVAECGGMTARLMRITLPTNSHEGLLKVFKREKAECDPNAEPTMKSFGFDRQGALPELYAEFDRNKGASGRSQLAKVMESVREAAQSAKAEVAALDASLKQNAGLNKTTCSSLGSEKEVAAKPGADSKPDAAKKEPAKAEAAAAPRAKDQSGDIAEAKKDPAAPAQESGKLPPGKDKQAPVVTNNPQEPTGAGAAAKVLPDAVKPRVIPTTETNGEVVPGDPAATARANQAIADERAAAAPVVKDGTQTPPLAADSTHTRLPVAQGSAGVRPAGGGSSTDVPDPPSYVAPVVPERAPAAAPAAGPPATELPPAGPPPAVTTNASSWSPSTTQVLVGVGLLGAAGAGAAYFITRDQKNKSDSSGTLLPVATVTQSETATVSATTTVTASSIATETKVVTGSASSSTATSVDTSNATSNSTSTVTVTNSSLGTSESGASSAASPSWTTLP